MKKNALLILFLSLFLSGCWDKHEIEEEAFVIVIGLDDSEREDGVSVTYQIANPQAGIANTGGEKEVSSEIITFTAPDFLTARDLANASVARKISFSHTKVIVVGEDFAKKEKFLRFLLSGIRDREVRRGIKLIVSKQKASEFIKNNNPKLETRPHKFYDLMTGRWEETGLVPLSNLQRYLQAFESKTEAFISVYASTEKEDIQEENGNEDDYLPGQIDQKGGNVTQLIGSAVFRKGIMVGTMTGEETRLTLNLRPKSIAKYMRVTYTDPLNPSFRIAMQLNKHEKTDIKINTKKEPLTVDVTIPLKLEILAIPSGENYVTNFKNQNVLKKHLEEQLEKKFASIVQKSIEEFQAGPFNWSMIARRNFWTIDEWEKYNWQEKYQSANINISVVVTFTGFGKQITPPRIE